MRYRLYPTVHDADLTARHNELLEWKNRYAEGYQGFIDAAWDDIQLRLLEMGKRPYLVMSPWSLRGVHISRTLELVFRDLVASSSPDGKYAKLAEHYAGEYRDGWSSLQLKYDYSDDGELDDDEIGVGGPPVIYISKVVDWRREW